MGQTIQCGHYGVYDFILVSISHDNRHFLPFKERRNSKQLTVSQFFYPKMKEHVALCA